MSIVESYAQELADPAQPLAVGKLANLSSIEPEEAALVRDVWLEMELTRRQRLVQELIDLAEDNVELNFEAVFFIALTDLDAGVRKSAIEGLWEYEERDLIDSLLDLLERDPNAGVRAESALSLGRFVLQGEFGKLAASDTERIERALRKAIDSTAEVVEVRGRALESIGAHSAPWVAELIQRAVESTDRRLLLSAVHAMGRSCDVDWLPQVIDALASDDAGIRFEAAGACGALGDAAAIPHLVAAIEEEDAEVQEAAVAALGEIGGTQAKETLEALIAGENERLRDAARAALIELDFATDPLGIKLEG